MLLLPSTVDVYMVVNLYLVAFCYVKWQLSMWLVGAIAERAGRMRKLTVLVTFCWVALISQIVAISNLYHDGLQDIPGPPSIITLVDNQHHELNNIESKLEENLEATLKNLSHNNVHTTVQTTVPLHADDHQQLVGVTAGDHLVDESNGTIEEQLLPQENEQPLLVLVPTQDPDAASSGSSLQQPAGDSSTTQEPSNEAPLATDTAAVVPPKPLEVNLTEENPMPVFSEWAQKQMAEAEKKLGEVVNASAMKKGTKPAGSKTGGGAMKLRAKNYAAPECGAKIIASNPEAQSTGSVLTAPKDEYLLNPCTSKIWFVVELCEPVQAERIELANFELFSSSPKEFSVSVSNRFPTRDWANVGQFTAKDERDVQSFQLHPHLFGKFVRVEILSHYNQEHFCPVSLFRVYGTSEFEAFETDNTPLQPEDDDDDDDELVGLTNGVGGKELLQSGNGGISVEGGASKEEHSKTPLGGKLTEEGSLEKLGHDAAVGRKGGKNPNNILKSAGEVVMNMVKKAAEALGKSGNDSNDSSIGGTPTERVPSREGGVSVTSVPTNLPAAAAASSPCVTLAYTIRCVNCTDHFRARLESLMNCKHNLLTSLLGVARIERSFDSAQHFLCANVLGFNLPRSQQGEDGQGEPALPTVCLNMRYSVLNLLPDELVAGLCNAVAFDLNLIAKSQQVDVEDKQTIDGTELKTNEGDSLFEHGRGDDGAKNLANQQQEEQATGPGQLAADINVSSKTNENENTSEQQRGQESENESKETVVTAPEGGSEQSLAENDSKEDVNMFNIATEPPTSTTIALEAADHDEAAPTAEGTKDQDQQQQQEHREKEDYTNNHHHWEAIDEGLPSEMAGTGPSGGFTTGPAATATTAPSGMATGHQKVQPESVFLRLSNRIKALERNMSLSGQYLEELSRRYRKQVEELQHSYAKTLHEIQEQNLRMADSEAKLREVNERLRQDLVDFQATATDWRNIALAMLVFIVLTLVILLAMVRSVANGVNLLANGHKLDGRQQPAPIPQSVIDRELAQVGSDAKPIRGRMLRRKSIDGMPTGGAGVDVTGTGVGSVSGIIIATGESSTGATSMSPARLRKKRPSEEALNISGTYVNLLIDDGEPVQSPPVALERKKSKHKHRKVSAPSMMAVSSSTPVNHEPAKRSVSMIEPPEQRTAERTPEKERSGRIDELPYLEDNDEFIIPTASDLSYDEYVPGSNASPGTDATDMERIANGTPSRNGSVPPQLLAGAGDAMEPKANTATTKASRRLSSPAFFKSSLLRSSLGSKKRSSKKTINGNSSSNNNTSSNSSSSNSSNSSAAPRELGAGDAGGLGESGGRNALVDTSWYRWWSSEQSSKMFSSSSTPSSSQEVAVVPSPPDSKHRQKIGKASSASPPSDGSKDRKLEPEPVKLSVSFNGDRPANGIGGTGGNGSLERKSSRGSIRRLFRKVF
ncbi:SUN domain-containing ossification factor isoform X2 [Anopheles stephensi]|uniref:SUN domain-containing ossification factor isoform X2 n=1 Tax=Anopheles stephensi TaxID=30069 RepID=UPI001658A9DB|nr:SUN domain-containing ossification factor isoform X2 [Anopheles stephensi]XP_035916925.1 SUN domain-containing ossification factor isoform X2 [Anopheles stephensi]XP_035916926.1 SUN domain-containing ossification factor isoform X2 [Anopheles stephensi]XP_035916927.1 SUN domain-containing ossification factor isoform X2 [Anopheles stephensi]XP_035916928.1 SUN domain-containing ossification factor isoform X2 [Anopheles stephensi]